MYMYGMYVWYVLMHVCMYAQLVNVCKYLDVKAGVPIRIPPGLMADTI